MVTLQHSSEPPARRQRIVDLVRSNGFRGIGELSALLGVSEMTVRRDIQQLAGQHLLRAVRGGASALVDIVEGIDFQLRAARERDAKRAIAARALELIEPGSTIALDSGTTTLEVARLLTGASGVSVLTSSLPALNVLARIDGIEAVGLGGLLHPVTQSFVGPLTLGSIRGLRAQTFFMAASAVRDGELYVSNAFEPDTKRALAEIADRVVLLVDHTKFGATSMYRVMPLASLDTVIADAVDPTTSQRLRRSGVEVIEVAITAQAGAGDGQ